MKSNPGRGECQVANTTNMGVSRRVAPEIFIAQGSFLYTGHLKTGNVKHIVESHSYSQVVSDKTPDESNNNVHGSYPVHRLSHKL